MLSDAQRAQMAARLRQKRTTSAQGGPRHPVIELTTGGSGQSRLFLFHAVGGTVFGYAHVCRALAGTHHVFGIEAQGLREGTRPAESLDEMAARYADLVRREQPTGPYALGGWSMGGILAFEVAKLLSDGTGEEVRLLLIDVPDRPRLAPRADFDMTVAFLLDACPQLGVDVRTLKCNNGDECLEELARRITRDGDSVEATLADLRRRNEVFQAHWSLLRDYRPVGSVAATALVACARTSPDSVPAWSKAVIGPVHARYLDADHYTCLRPPYAQQIGYAFETM
jgi:thioesterase domain-containing protein